MVGKLFVYILMAGKLFVYILMVGKLYVDKRALRNQLSEAGHRSESTVPVPPRLPAPSSAEVSQDSTKNTNGTAFTSLN
jgi:hypothetical protein